MPLLVFVLSRFGIVSAGFLWKHFKYAVLAIFILAARDYAQRGHGDAVDVCRADAGALHHQYCRGMDFRPAQECSLRVGIDEDTGCFRQRSSWWWPRRWPAGMVGTRAGATQDVAQIDSRYRIYKAALPAIEKEYAEPVDGAQMIYGSIDGMLRTLDPHSSFFDPKDYARMREQQSGRTPASASASCRSTDDYGHAVVRGIARPTGPASAANDVDRARRPAGPGRRQARGRVGRDQGLGHRRGRQARERAEGHDGRDFDPPSRRRHA